MRHRKFEILDYMYIENTFLEIGKFLKNLNEIKES